MVEIKKTRDSICMSCCDSSKTARNVSISRNGGSYKGMNIVTLGLCNDCLKKLTEELVQIVSDI